MDITRSEVQIGERFGSGEITLIFYDREGNEIGRRDLGDVTAVFLESKEAPEGAAFARIEQKATPGTTVETVHDKQERRRKNNE